MDNDITISITDADFYLKRKPPLAIPRRSRLLLRHEMNLEGTSVVYDVRFTRTSAGSSVWQEVSSGWPAVAGRLFRTDADVDIPEDLRQLARALVRSRWPFEVAGELIDEGLISADLWAAERDAFESAHRSHADAAADTDLSSPSPLVETARMLGLGPRPQGEAAHQWTARCPRGSHPILISTSSEQFGCPWCRRKGGVDELLAFAAEYNVFPKPAIAVPSTRLDEAHSTDQSDTDGIDWTFRPETYFGRQSGRHHLISRVSNAVLRERLELLSAEGREDEVDALLGTAGISRDDARELEALAPILLGGNYLPELLPGEVEIARIRLASTTFDVTAVYARRTDDIIHYRVVDEYEGDTLQDPTTTSSRDPLTLVELVEFFLEAWPLDEVLTVNFDGDDEQAETFFHPSSTWYPQFDRAVRMKARSERR